MSFEDDRQRQVRTGQAINLAIQLATNARIGEHPDTVIAEARGLVPRLVSFINEVQALQEGAVQPFPQAQTAASGVQGVVEAFPGSQVEQAPQYAPQPVQQFQPVPAPAPQPAPIPNQSRGGGDWKAQKAEEAFKTFFQDTTAWYDNRAKKFSGEYKPTAADFTHRTLKDGNYKLGIWLKDAPQWALPQLQQMGLVA